MSPTVLLSVGRWSTRRVAGVALLILVLAGAVYIQRHESGTSQLEQGTPAAHPLKTTHYVGWAMEAYPGDSLARLQGEMRRQIRAGANVVWLGHNNPGEVGYDKVEPALSYAVWMAARDRRAIRHDEAVAMIAAQTEALAAARSLRVRVVLPIGYQIQMGKAWNTTHPADLRRTASGEIYDASGGPNQSASFYAPSYRRAMLSYYRWIERSIVRPYRSTILMLNLADEPEGGDYSSWADRAFRAEHGFGLLDAGDDPARQEAVGQFESNYIVEYARWSARAWLRLDRTLPVTMSFCGGYSRLMHEGPNLEGLFRAPPANFVVTFDAYPRDGLFTTPLRDADLTALFTLVRTLGYYSSLYHRPLWLWSAANSWGLNGASPDPGGIADAMANGISLALLARQSGGLLQGLAVWNYNIRGQGLFNDTHRLTYDPNRMFARVSSTFPLLRTIMASRPGRIDTLALAPDASTLRIAGAAHAMRAGDIYRWSALDALARADVIAPVVTHLDAPPAPAVHTALVLARTPTDLRPGDTKSLRALLHRGGIVIAARSVATFLSGEGGHWLPVAAEGTRWRAVGFRSGRGGVVSRLRSPHGTLFGIAGLPVEEVLADRSRSWASAAWKQMLGRRVPEGSYMVTLGAVTLLYSIDRDATVLLPSTGRRSHMTLSLYGKDGLVRRSVPLHPRQGSTALPLARRTFALLRRLPQSPHVSQQS